jgi:hypothetical protein
MRGGGWRAVRGRGAIALTVAACALAAVLWLWIGSPASAASGGEQARIAKPKGKGEGGGGGKGKKPTGGREGRAVGQLKRAGCPPYRAITQQKYSSAARRAAQHWKFEVFHFKTRLKPPINWEKDPHQSRSFRQSLHGFAWMDTLLYSYRRTRDDAVLRRARDIALDWIKSNPRRFKPGRRGFAWHAKAAADRAGYLGFLTRTAGCRGLLNRKQAGLMVRSLNAHGRYLANAGQHQASNFGLFQDLGLLLLSEYLPFEGEAEKWRKLAVARFPQTLLGRLSPEWVWLEHSTQYQFLAIRLLRNFIKWKPGKERDPILLEVLNRMRDATGWFVDPDGEYALLGDTAFGEAPDWGYYKGRTYEGLKTFRESGFAIARQGGSYLATTAGFFNTTHKHADELDFELFDRGLKIVNGPGNYGYDREEAYRDYQLSSQSHSVLLSNGQSFPIEAQNAYGSAIQATGQGSGWFAIQGTNPLIARQGVGHTRLFLYRPGETLVIVDQVQADAPQTYHRYFQLGPRLEIEDRGGGELALNGPSFNGAVYDRATATGGAGPVWVKGQTAPLQGFTFPGFRRAVPRWSVDYVSQTTNADFLTIFTLNGSTQRGSVTTPSDTETRIALTRADGSGQTISVTRNGGSLSIVPSG